MNSSVEIETNLFEYTKIILEISTIRETFNLSVFVFCWFNLTISLFYLLVPSKYPYLIEEDLKD